MKLLVVALNLAHLQAQQWPSKKFQTYLDSCKISYYEVEEYFMFI